MKRFISMSLAALSLSAPWVQAAPDKDIVLQPAKSVFGEVNLGSASTVQTLTLSNLSDNPINILGVPTLAGPDASEFRVVTNNCSGILAGQGECTIDVSFRPFTAGSKLAMLELPVSDAETPVISAFLMSEEDYVKQGERRLPAMLSSTNLGLTVDPSENKTINWTALGYHENYESYLVVFNCGQPPVDPDCGSVFNPVDPEVIYFSPFGVPAMSVTQQDEWIYKGKEAQLFHYETTISSALWAAKVHIDDELVVRFFYKSTDDAAAGNGSLSLLVPGNLGVDYFDNEGRRLRLTVVLPGSDTGP